MNINTESTFLSGQRQPLQKIRHLTPDLDVKLRSQFNKEKGLLMDAAATLKISDEGREMSSQNADRVIEAQPVHFNHVIYHLTRTGYTAIDNSIVDAMEGQSAEVKNYVYGIISQNFLREDAGDMTERERQDAISLGLAEAKHIANNYMDKDTAKSFMQAMTKVANIASSGVRDEDGKMDYCLPLMHSEKTGRTVELSESLGNIISMMREHDPEAYAKYRECMNALLEGDDDNWHEKLSEAMRIQLRFIYDTAQDDFKRYSREVQARINNTSTDKLSDTFAGIEAKDNVSFFEAIMKRWNETSYLQGDYWDYQMFLLLQMCKE